jgi:hypothetical protein
MPEDKSDVISIVSILLTEGRPFSNNTSVVLLSGGRLGRHLARGGLHADCWLPPMCQPCSRRMRCSRPCEAQQTPRGGCHGVPLLLSSVSPSVPRLFAGGAADPTCWVPHPELRHDNQGLSRVSRPKLAGWGTSIAQSSNALQSPTRSAANSTCWVMHSCGRGCRRRCDAAGHADLSCTRRIKPGGEVLAEVSDFRIDRGWFVAANRLL